jgi:hypothetical protein
MAGIWVHTREEIVVANCGIESYFGAVWDAKTVSFLLLLDLDGRDTKTVPVPEEQHALVLAHGILVRLNPLTPPRTLPQALQEANRTTLNVRAIMFAHNRFDGFGGLICVVEGNGRDVVVKDVGFDNAVEESTTDEAEFAVDCCGGATGEGPGFGLVVRKRGIGVLEVGDCDC